MGGEKKKTHWLKSSCGDWSVETDGRHVAGVVSFIKGFNAERIAQAATAYKDAHKAVGDVQKALEEQAGQLAKVWDGKASVEAQKALGILHVTLGELATKLQKMHEPVQALSTVVRKHQEFIDDDIKGVMPTWANQGGMLGGTWDDSVPDIFSTYSGVYGGDSAKGDFGSQDELAGLHLKTFANDLAHVHTMIPDTVEKVLRDIDYPTGPQITPPTVTYPKGGPPYPTGNPDPYGPGGLQTNPINYDPSATDPNNRFPTNQPNPNALDPNALDPNGTNPNGTGDPNGTNGNNGNNGNGTGNPGSPTFQNPDTSSLGSNSPNGSNPAFNPAAYQDPSANRTTSLQDYTPTNTNGWTPTTGTAHPTTTGNTGYNMPSTSYPPGTTAGGPGTATGGGITGANPAITTAATRATTANAGMPFLPMGAGGGGGAQHSEKQESTTWLHEDDDVWGTDSDSVVNSQIG
ncbi:WXG100 family type VII secretion target [Nonomuraea wenchangensis]|uniref:WXG100 family type VII secretion target n=1 Tax=Nonomuraea wenchangensis TaxID=568860 RepID=UPI0034421757